MVHHFVLWRECYVFWLLIMNPMVLFHRPEGLIKVMQVFFFNQSSLFFCSRWEIFLFTPILTWTTKLLSVGKKVPPNVQSLKSAVFNKAYSREISEMVCLTELGTFIQYDVPWNQTGWRSPGLVFQPDSCLKPVMLGCCGQVDGLICLSLFKLFSSTISPRVGVTQRWEWKKGEFDFYFFHSSTFLLFWSFLWLLCVQKQQWAVIISHFSCQCPPLKT